MPVKINSPVQPGVQASYDSKKKRKTSDHSENEKKAPAISFEVYHSEAVTFQSIGEFRKAINSYTKALELKPKDKNCYILRAQCYLRLGEAEKALDDANETLKDDNNFIKGILMKAESYYQMMQFEYALMFFHRGNKLRPEVQAFRLGIQKSHEAIDNSIGDNAGVRLQTTGDLSYFFVEQQVKPKQVVTYSRMVTKIEEVPEERRSKFGLRDSKSCKQLLGELYADKEFLEKLLQETETASNQTNTNKAIRNLAIRGLDYLDTRSEFWQQQKPMYSRRRDKNIRENVCDSASSDRARNPSRWVLKTLEEIDEAQVQGRYEASLKQAKKVLREVERSSDGSVRNLPEFIANLHSCIGNSHLELGDYSEALKHHNMDYDIAKKHHLADAESRALDNLGRVHARMGNFDKAIEVWKRRLPMSKSPLESTWLYHEIGRCHLEMGEFEDARDFGEKSLSAAEKVSDGVWQLNAMVLVAQSQVKLDELYSALDTFEKAQDLAKCQKDEAAELAIQKAIDDVNKTLKKKEGYKESGRSSSKHESRRSSISSPNEMKRQHDENATNKSDAEDSPKARNKDSDDERRENETEGRDTSDDDERRRSDSGDETGQRNKQNSVSGGSEREQSDNENTDAARIGKRSKNNQVETSKESKTKKSASGNVSKNFSVKLDVMSQGKSQDGKKSQTRTQQSQNSKDTNSLSKAQNTNKVINHKGKKS